MTLGKVAVATRHRIRRTRAKDQRPGALPEGRGSDVAYVLGFAARIAAVMVAATARELEGAMTATPLVAARGSSGPAHLRPVSGRAHDTAISLSAGVPADNRHWSFRSLRRGLPRLAAIALMVAVCAGCGSQSETVGSYKPEFLPVALSISQSGISIEGTQSIVTPIGTFSIGALYELPPRDPSSIYVTLRDRRTGFDRIFEVRTGADQFMAVVNGTTGISIANGQVLIDITDGSIKQVSFKQVPDQISQQHNSNWLEKLWHVTIIRWIIIIMTLGLILRRIIRGY